MRSTPPTTTVAACAALLLLATFGTPALADIFFDENFGGDISNDRFNPTPFTLDAGDNQLVGVIFGVDGEGNVDRDYYSITIPAGLQLAQIIHDNYISTDFGAFMGIEQGPIFPVAPEDATPDGLFGWAIFGPSTVGVDLLPTMGGNGRGFTPPLPAGTYTFWTQQTGEYTDYIMNFVVTEVPAPTAAAAPLAALLLLQRRRRR